MRAIIGDQLGAVHRLQRDGHGPGFDAGEIEDVIDQREQVAACLHHVADGVAVLFRQGAEFEQLPETEDGVEGCPQLVAHPGEELALGGVGARCFPLCPLGGLLGLLERFSLGTFFGEQLAPFECQPRDRPHRAQQLGVLPAEETGIGPGGHDKLPVAVPDRHGHPMGGLAVQ
jgi:hypothetical protein